MPEQFGGFIARLTDNARVSLQHAEALARGQGSAYVGTEHLLLGILTQKTSVGAKLLADAGITLQRAELALNLTPQSLQIASGVKGLSDTALLTLKMAHDQASGLHQEYLGTEHILYSIVQQKGARATVLLRDMQTDIEQLVDDIEEYFDRQQSQYDDSGTSDSGETGEASLKRSHLAKYGIDMTKQARDGKYDTVIGRATEIERVATVLTRRTKNNPVLIGEPGVGKTAIVEGLALAIVSGDVPEHLRDATLVQLDLSSMVAGTKYRGEFEERLKKTIDEAKAHKHMIVFIDELHLLVGAGSAEGTMDAANILKPSLARGEFQLIGATTFDEYRKSIETDSALERRFQSVVVKEPSSKQTLHILHGLRPHYEKHHHVTLSDDVLERAVEMSDRYISHRFRPDKAIDVIDEAAALARVRHTPGTRRSRQIRDEITQLEQKIEESVQNEDYERAALYKMRLSQLREKHEAELGRDAEQTLKLGEQDIARAVAAITSIPVENVARSEQSILLDLEKHLAKSLVGQPEAITAVSRAIRRNRSGVSSGRRPIGSFIFLGPTGVGKTELARVLALEVFGREDALIKIDMSEFSEKHTSSRLVGAPAGYIGYEDGGKLTDQVRRQPYSVVLFDEIEKAHPDVFQLLLQLLEDGTLTDAKGRSVDFRNTIIILTSNLGSDSMVRESELGFTAESASERTDLAAVHQRNATAARKALDRFMRPELINRFDALVTFSALNRQDVRRILTRLLDELSVRMSRKGIGLSVTPAAKRWLIDHGFDARTGVRPLRRLIEDTIEHEVARVILSGQTTPGAIVTIDKSEGTLKAQVLHESSPVKR